MNASQTHSDKDENLLEVLVNKGLISKAQAELVSSDSSATGMAIDEILLARGWVKEEDLLKFAPMLKEKDKVPSSSPDKELSYEDNLKKYRLILADILGESSE